MGRDRIVIEPVSEHEQLFARRKQRLVVSVVIAMVVQRGRPESPAVFIWAEWQDRHRAFQEVV
jgi:hypothetical protein